MRFIIYIEYSGICIPNVLICETQLIYVKQLKDYALFVKVYATLE